MTTTHPQWKPLPDSPGIWVLERESELAALLGAKYAILDIKQCSLDRPTSRKYCVRAYGPITTEAPAAQIIHTAKPIQFSTHDRQQLQIEQIIRDMQTSREKGERVDFRIEQITRDLETLDRKDNQERKERENEICELRRKITELQKEPDDTIPADFDVRVTILEKTTNSLQRNIEQEKEARKLLEAQHKEQIDLLRKEITELAEEIDAIETAAIRDDVELRKQIEQEKETRIANDRAQVKFAAALSTRLDMHAKDLAELTNDTKEADKKILANAGDIARIIRHLERLPREQPTPDITEPTATAWNTNPEKMLRQINAELNRPPTGEVKPEDIW